MAGTNVPPPTPPPTPAPAATPAPASTATTPPSATQDATVLSQEILALVAGTVKRESLSTDQWNTLIAFTGTVLGANQAHTDLVQPLILFQKTLAALGQTQYFKKAFAQGVKSGVWVKDATTGTGWIYSNKYSGQPGTIAPGPTGPGGFPVTPPAKLGAGGSNSKYDALVAAFTNTVTGMNMNPADVQSLINSSAKSGWTVDQFSMALQNSSAFHQAFPGIFQADGSLKMSPSQYLVTQQSYTAYAQTSGINLPPNKMATLFQNNVSPAEFQLRAQALSSLKTNQAMFQQFNIQLKQEGQAALSKQDLFKFVMGEGSAAWYKTWNDASSRYAGTQAGITFGHPSQGYTNLSQKVVDNIGSKGLSATDLATRYTNLAKDLTTTFPDSKIQSMGLSKKDLVQLEFGGPRQAAIAQKVQQIMDNETAFNQGQVNTATAPGLGANTGTQEKYAQSQ